MTISVDALGVAEVTTARNLHAAAAEFIATLLFVFVGAGTVVTVVGALGQSPLDDAAALVAIALAHGLAIAFLVAATANISGGHINPAITFAAVITGRMKPAVGGLYVAAQLIGAVVGAAAIKFVFVDAAATAANLGAHGLNPDGVSGAGLGFVAEIILTFALVFVVFATAIDPRGLAHLAPFAIGVTILVDHLIGVPLTGASMNPARSFGPALMANVWDNHWIYWLGPLVGGGIAGLLYHYVFILGRQDSEG